MAVLENQDVHHFELEREFMSRQSADPAVDSSKHTRTSKPARQSTRQ